MTATFEIVTLAFMMKKPAVDETGGLTTGPELMLESSVI